jgi:hypothetical protein
MHHDLELSSQGRPSSRHAHHRTTPPARRPRSELFRDGCTRRPVRRTFLSTAITDGGAPHDLVAGTRIRLTFGTDGQLGVSAGCNMMGGSYRLDGDILRLRVAS